MSKVLCSQVLWAQVFNLLWFNAIYWDGWRTREAGSWAERPTWIGRGKSRVNHPIWCSRSDCWRWVISSLHEKDSRGKCFRRGSADGQQSKLLLSVSSKLWSLLPFPSVMCWSYSSWAFMCSVVCCSGWEPVVCAADSCWCSPSWCASICAFARLESLFLAVRICSANPMAPATRGS